MNTSNSKEGFELSPEELAQLGNGALSYIREIEGRDVIRSFSACSTPMARRSRFREPAKPQPTAPWSMSWWRSACTNRFKFSNSNRSSRRKPGARHSAIPSVQSLGPDFRRGDRSSF